MYMSVCVCVCVYIPVYTYLPYRYLYMYIHGTHTFTYIYIIKKNYYNVFKIGNTNNSQIVSFIGLRKNEIPVVI